MKKVLIIHATYGNGHKMVAKYIQNYFTNQGDCEVEVIDLLDYASPFIKKVSLKLFEKTMFAKLPFIWELIYKFYNNKYRSIGTKKMCYKLFDKAKLRKKISEFNPDIIVSSHYFGSMIAAKYKKDNLINAKLYTIITDYEVHEFWTKTAKEDDAIIISTKEMKNDLIKRNIPKEKIKIFGIPISDNFDNDLDQEDLKRKFNLDNNKPTILFFGGGNNSSSSLPFFKRLLVKNYNFNIIFVAGNNPKLKNKVNELVREYNSNNVTVLGYITNVYEYMSACDVVVSKPGGLTVSECLALHKPMILINRNAGQEKGNYKYLVKKRYAFKASKPYQFSRIITIISLSPNILSKMSKKIAKRSNKKSVEQLYKLVMKK